MKKGLLYSAIVMVTLASCQKEYSDESGSSGGAGLIVGADCRINKIAYNDSATGVATGSLAATIDGTDVVTDITKFDSLTLTLDFNSGPQYFSDTVAIDPSQYLILDHSTKRVDTLHGLIDPSINTSPEFDIAYNYDAAGFLINKAYYYSLFPGVPYQTVSYTYTGGNLTGMVAIDNYTGDTIKKASLTYYTNIAPKNYLYLFPDENTYAEYSQFFNFGRKSTNAVKDYKVYYYTNGVVTDSTISAFSSYIMSRDNYVLNVYMLGSDQSSIPAPAGKLSFSYHCK